MIVQTATSLLDTEVMINVQSVFAGIHFFILFIKCKLNIRRSFYLDNFNNLSNFSKFNHLSYSHFSRCAVMSSASLIHLILLFCWPFFPFHCCACWDVTCRKRNICLCVYSTIQDYQVRIKPYPLFFFFWSQAAEQFLLVLRYRPQTSRFSSSCSLHAFCFTESYPDLQGVWHYVSQ